VDAAAQVRTDTSAPPAWAPNAHSCRDECDFGEVAWKVADQLGWSNRYNAEYVALTQLQADAFITLDGQLAHAVKDLVKIAPIEALS
jgi:hypothetical protein